VGFSVSSDHLFGGLQTYQSGVPVQARAAGSGAERPASGSGGGGGGGAGEPGRSQRPPSSGRLQLSVAQRAKEATAAGVAPLLTVKLHSGIMSNTKPKAIGPVRDKL